MKLQAAIKYAEDDMKACVVILFKNILITLFFKKLEEQKVLIKKDLYFRLDLCFNV